MTQENQGAIVVVPNHDTPVKRKRGRPRKDRNQAPPQAQAQVRVPITSTPAQVQMPITPNLAQVQVPITPALAPITPTPTQGQVSIAPPPITETKNHQRRKLDIVANTKSDMVGQAVFGVLDGSFEAGYLLTVKVGDTDTVLKGVVFQPGSTVPVSVSNDVAPHIRMLKRTDVHIPQQGIQQIARSPENPATAVTQVPPMVPPQPLQVPHIVPSQLSQVPPIVPTHLPQVLPIVTTQPQLSQVPPIVPPQLSQVPPIVPPPLAQPQPLNDIAVAQGSVQGSSQSNDILPAHPQPDLQHNETVIHATLPETQPPINNNIQVGAAEEVTVLTLSSQKDDSEGQGSSIPSGGGVPVSNEAATTHGELGRSF